MAIRIVSKEPEYHQYLRQDYLETGMMWTDISDEPPLVPEKKKFALVEYWRLKEDSSGFSKSKSIKVRDPILFKTSGKVLFQTRNDTYFMFQGDLSSPDAPIQC